MKDFQQRKAAIMNDSRLKDDAKRADLVDLYKAHIKDLEEESAANEEALKGLFQKQNNIKAQTFKKPLPSIKEYDQDKLFDYDHKVFAGIMSNMVALMNEERQGARLIGSLLMCKDAAKFTEVVSEAIYSNPSATLQVWPQIMQVAAKYIKDVPGTMTALEQFYASAIENDKTPDQKKWEDQQRSKMNDLDSKIGQSSARGVTLGLIIDNAKKEMNNVRAEAMFAGDTPRNMTREQKGSAHYFGDSQ